MSVVSLTAAGPVDSYNRQKMLFFQPLHDTEQMIMQSFAQSMQLMDFTQRMDPLAQTMAPFLFPLAAGPEGSQLVQYSYQPPKPQRNYDEQEKNFIKYLKPAKNLYRVAY
jgi:hypothetical protein